MEHPLGSATHQGETGVECADVSMWRIGRVASTYRYSQLEELGQARVRVCV